MSSGRLGLRLKLIEIIRTGAGAGGMKTGEQRPMTRMRPVAASVAPRLTEREARGCVRATYQSIENPCREPVSF